MSHFLLKEIQNENNTLSELILLCNGYGKLLKLKIYFIIRVASSLMF